MNSSLSPAWQQCHDAFLADIESRSGSLRSRQTYSDILRLFFADTGKSPDACTRADVLAFAASPSHGKRAGRPVSVSTRNGRVSALTSFYRFAATYAVDGQSLFTAQSPCLGLRYLRPQIRYRAMSSEEFSRLLSVIPDTLVGIRDKAAILTYFWTARRKSEILALRWRDIESASLRQADGTMHAGHIYRFTQKGTSREIRTAELPEPAFQAIESYLVRVGRRATIQPDHPVFTAVYRGQGRRDRALAPLTGCQLGMHLKTYLKLAGLDDDRRLSLHSIRHTSARLRYESGSDIRAIQTVLGHSSLATTDLYLRSLVGIDDPGASLLERKFGRLGALG